jgi:hypothetical protein
MILIRYLKNKVLRCSTIRLRRNNSKWANTQVCPYRENSLGQDESNPYKSI